MLTSSFGSPTPAASGEVLLRKGETRGWSTAQEPAPRCSSRVFWGDLKKWGIYSSCLCDIM